MIDIKHKRNGQYITNPLNWEDLEIVNDFTEKGNDVFDVGVSELVFAGEEATKIIERIKNGTSGGVGLFEGDKYEIELSNGLNFEGFLDYASGVKVSGCNEVSVQLRKKHGKTWLNSVGDSFSFRYLESIGIITRNDYVKIPYVINNIPDSAQLLILSISLFIMTKELAEAVVQTASAASEIVNASTPVLGSSVGAGAGVVTAWDFGDYAQASLKLAAYIVYTATIVVAIISLIDDIFNQILGEKRDHLGVKVKTLFEKACQHLGLRLSSTILNRIENWVIMPAKDHEGGEKPKNAASGWVESGLPVVGSAFDTFGDLLRVFLTAFNADYKIKDNVFYFERRDYWKEKSSYIIPDYFTNQERLYDEYKFNTQDMISNYAISWEYDTQDQNTLENQNGRVFQAITEPKIKLNQDYVNIKNLTNIKIPCSLSSRKESLTAVEELLTGLGKLADKITSIFGRGTSYQAKVKSRKGSLNLSSHFTSLPKMVVMNGAVLASNQREILDAKKFWDDYHYIESFVTINNNHNQYLEYEDVKIPFSYEDYISLLQNNLCKTTGGYNAEITLLKWKVFDNFAFINYRVNKKYTDNLKLKII